MPKIPTREIYWNVPGHPWMYAAEAALFVILGYGVYRVISAINKGTGSIALAPLLVRTRQMLMNVWLHKKIREKPSGADHLYVFYGFVILTIGTTLIFIQELTKIVFLKGTFYLWYSLILDTAGLLALVALTAMMIRRFKRYGIEGYGKDAWMSFFLWLIILTGFLLEGLRLAATMPDDALWSPVGLLLFGLPFYGMEQSSLLTAHNLLWWFHLIISFGFLAAIPYSKLLHMAVGTVNHLTKTLPPKMKLSTPDLEASENFGAAKASELSKRDLLDGFACMACGRCDDVCPASATGKPLHPRRVMLAIRKASLSADSFLIESSENKSGGYAAPISGTPISDAAPTSTAPISDDELWDCTTCGACQQVCPVYIEPINKIVDMRRNLTMSEGRYPKEVTGFFKNEETNANPWGLSWETRADWAKGLNVPIAGEKKEFEYLFWVGCAGSYDGRYKKVSVAMAEILRRAGLDYAILGSEEKCSGDPLRRLGNEYQFQILAKENMEVFKKYNVQKIVTACPHCYNIFKNEYSDFGLTAEVLHHSQLIEKLTGEGKLPAPESGDGKVVYHDSCYLGRYNKVYDAPRAMTGDARLEVERKFCKSFCCGAGGGRMWMEETTESRINITRTDELLATNPSAIATACPFCMTMITDGVKARGKQDDVPVKDVCEILLERLL